MMKRLSAICLALLLACLPILSIAEETGAAELSASFEEMSIEELQSLDESLHAVLNEKLIGSAELVLSETELQLAEGKKAELEVSCTAREITKDTEVTYSSSDEDVVTVSKGKIKAVGGGQAVVTVTAAFEDGAQLTAECKVTVVVPVKFVKLDVDKDEATVPVGGSVDLAELVKVSPEDATIRDVTYEVDDTEIASVDAQGVLTGIKAGTVKVTVTSAEKTDDPESTTVKYSVLQPVEAITISEDKLLVGNGNSRELEWTVGPEEATVKDVTWSSADESVAKVSSKGKVTGEGSGTTTITCTAVDGSGVTASVEVEVITAVKKVELSAKELTLMAGSDQLVTAEVSPQDATDPTLKWTSSDTSVATVDADGRITAKSSGECKITAAAADGNGAEASVTVYVEPKNPVYVTSIHWQSTWGQKNGKMGVTAESLCSNRTIKSFDYIVKCTSYYNGAVSTELVTYEGSAIKPGKSQKSKLTKYSVSGFATAYQVEITPTKVYFSDGSSQEIPEEYRYTSSFTM